MAVGLRGLMRALSEKGFDTHVLALDAADGDPTARRYMPGAASDAIKTADVIHIHGWGHQPGAEISVAARRAGTPYLISPVGLLSHGPYRTRTWRDKLRALMGGNKVIGAASALLAVNAAELADLTTQRLNARTLVLPYGIDVEAYETPTDPTDTPSAELEGRCLLLLGPIHPITGIIPLLKSFAELGLDNEGWHVVVAGDACGEWRGKLEAGIRRKGATDRVLFTEAKDEHAQRALLRRASMLAAVHLNIGCPVPVVQAMATGVPVLATDCVVPDGLNGAVRTVSPRRTDIKEALRGLMRLTDEERSALAAGNRELVRSRFDWRVLVDRYADLYTSVAR